MDRVVLHALFLRSANEAIGLNVATGSSLLVRFLIVVSPWQASANPANTIFDVKRLIGRKYSDPSVKADVQLFPFKGEGESPPRPAEGFPTERRTRVAVFGEVSSLCFIPLRLNVLPS